ncbi:hypothetical protein QUB76_16625, partial [Microcoleus sp. D2B6]|uniref:hypothetical protein n=1 Tax=unclassified Microcoleus TaxID=2642155 RepID=UPI002FD7275B
FTLISYLRIDYRDSLINESHFHSTFKSAARLPEVRRFISAVQAASVQKKWLLTDFVTLPHEPQGGHCLPTQNLKSKI